MAYVFVYGSLLSPNELIDVGIDPSKCKPAVLPGYRITFDKKSIKRCAAANLEKCEEDGCRAIGIACEVDVNSEAFEELDRREVGYNREPVTCRLIGEDELEVEAYTYISGKRLSSDEIKKCTNDKRFCDYLKIIADGLSHWNQQVKGFIEQYLEAIKSDNVHSDIIACLRTLLRI